ncbi:hypothetical protein EGW08_017906 [Elysia chlorotica]|uniref:DUF6729 domain-containing protein n=1 Tax=Elysia chlorotica TaxID=188477 RepID=A0A3S0ZC60_ELYCH|nr:hypothetical protein EGW08_017906 [Elysia chlorotica]
MRKEWLKTLPDEDHVWVSKALFTDSGKLKRDLRSMWYHPPQPAAVYSRPPGPPATPSVFFLWMPYPIWGYLFYPFECSQPGCARRQLHSCGLYKTVRRVIDQVDDYYMGTEYLECGRCHKSPGWSLELLDQLGYVVNNIISNKTNRVSVSLYGSYQSIKYHLLNKKMTSVQLFRRDDITYGPVDKSLVYHIQTAWQRRIKKDLVCVAQNKPTKKTAHQKCSQQISEISDISNKSSSKRATPDSDSLLDSVCLTSASPFTKVYK